MKRIDWLTDIHLDFLRTDAAQRFARHVAETEADVVLISGDIAEFTDLVSILQKACPK